VDIQSAIQSTVRLIYVLSGLLWLAAIGFAAFRHHQMRTLLAVEAEVLEAETESYLNKITSRDMDGKLRDSTAQMYVPTAMVRYQFSGKVFTVKAGHDTATTSKSFEDSLKRQWKPGTRIRIHIDPARPGEPVLGLGMNLHTYLVSAALIVAGAIIAAFGYAMGWAAGSGVRLFERFSQT
jgi:hypothetical protein